MIRKMRYMAILALGILTLMTLSCSETGSDSKKGEIPASLKLYSELRSTDKMTFASMSITKSVKMESDAWYKVGKRIAVYSYDSHMRAYIDMSELQESDLIFDDSRHTVRITLPPIVTEVSGRDMTMRKEYENIGLFRSNLTSQERAEMKERANESFMREVEKNPEFRKRLTDEAERKARKYFETLCESAGYTASIDFKKQ